MGKKLSEDHIKWILSLDASDADKEIHKITERNKELQSRNKELSKSIREVELRLGKESKEYRQLSAEYSKNNTKLAKNREALKKLENQQDLNNLSMVSLKRRAQDLQKQLDSTSRSLHPQEWNKLNDSLSRTRQRMIQLQNEGKKIESSSGLIYERAKGMVLGGLMMKAGAFLGEITKKVINFGIESMKVAASAEGVLHAYKKIDDPGLLSNLREATKGTVSDLNLMKTAVKAKDFRIPLQDLGKYLQFARLKAQETGESVEYMTDSIITGLGRKSVMILDNLGLSAAEINEEISKTGDFMSSVAKIIDKQLAKAGDNFISRADKMQQRAVILENAKLKLGKALTWLHDKFQSFTTNAAKALSDALTTNVERYDETRERVVNLVTELPPLVEEYNKLKSKSSLSADEQERLKKIISEIASAVPGAATAFDSYGNAIEISTDKVEEFIAKQKALLQYQNKAAIDQVTKDLEGYRKKYKVLLQEQAQGGRLQAQVGGMFQVARPILRTDLLPEIEADIKKYGQLISGAEQELDRLRGDSLEKALREERERIEYRKKFLSMNKQQLDAWIKDEKNAKSQYKAMAEEFFNTRFSVSPEILKERKKSEEERKKSEEKDLKDRIETEKEAVKSLDNLRNEALTAKERFYNNEVANLNDMLSKNLISKEQHEYRMLELEKSYSEERLRVEQTCLQDAQSMEISHADTKEEIIRKSSERVVIAEKEAADKRAALQSKLTSILSEFKAQFNLNTVQEDLALQYNMLESSYLARRELMIKEGLDTTALEGAYNQAKEQIELNHQQRLYAIREQYGINTFQESLKGQLELLKQSKAQGLLTEEEYEQAVQNLKRDSYKKQFDYYANLFSGAIQSLQQAEMDQVDAKYDAEIEAAKGDAEEVERLENEKAQKKLDIQKKYADVNFAIKASQIIADTAVSIMKAYADLGPIGGAIAAALLGITGIAQLASANAEREKVKSMTLSGGGASGSSSGARVATGRQSGGKIDVRREQDGKFFPDADFSPDARGFIDRPTVIVGEGPAGQSKEWVASNAAVENPTVAPILSILDKSQQAGTIRTLDLGKVLQARMAGYSSGGSVSHPAGTPAPSSGNGGSSLPPALMEKFARAVVRLDEDGFPPATVSLTDFERKQALRNRSRKIGSKS